MTTKDSVQIHPTAIVEDSVILDENVAVGPYSILRGQVKIGSGTVIKERVTIEGNTTIGCDNVIFTGAVIGSVTQDKKFDGGNSYVRIGDRNQFREYITINAATDEGGETIIGNDNLLMAYAHVAHDCVVGNHVTFANVATLAGHVTVEDHAIIGGLSAVHQFIRIGRLSIIGGCSKVVQDIPPFMMVDGHPARAFGINSIGLDRFGMTAEEKKQLKNAFKILYRSKLSPKGALSQMKQKLSDIPVVQELIAFVASSERGICS